MNKKYNPFSMYLPSIGFGLGWLIPQLISSSSFLMTFDTSGIIILFNWAILGFLIGWGINSLWRIYK